jgi:hypothetical protein
VSCRYTLAPELGVGQAIVFLGRPYLITAIEPHLQPIVAGSRIAYSGEWSITVNPGDAFQVLALEARAGER